MGQVFGQMTMTVPYGRSELRELELNTGLKKDQILYHANCPKCTNRENCVLSTGMDDARPRWFGTGAFGKVTAALIINEKSRMGKDAKHSEHTGDCFHDGALMYTYRVTRAIEDIADMVTTDPPDDASIYKWDTDHRLRPFSGIYRLASTMLFGMPMDYELVEKERGGHTYMKRVPLHTEPYMAPELILRAGWASFLEIVSVDQYDVSAVNKYIDDSVAHLHKTTTDMIQSMYNAIPWNEFVIHRVYPNPAGSMSVTGTDSAYRQGIVQNTVIDWIGTEFANVLGNTDSGDDDY